MIKHIHQEALLTTLTFFVSFFRSDIDWTWTTKLRITDNQIIRFDRQ